MTNTSTPAWLLRLTRRQLTYLLTAVAVVGIFWAITGRGPSLAATFIYSFVLGNLTAFAIDYVKIPYAWRQAPTSVFVYIGLLAIVVPIAVIIATTIVYVAVPPVSLPPAPRDSVWVFLKHAWRFPSVASVIYGAGYVAHIVNRNRLEDRNRELQLTIASGVAERELDAAELRQAREIQTDLLPKEIPQLPQFQITGVWEPAKLVGGDYYDVIQLSRDKVGICIADVVGKGISAALLMANLQASLRAFASETASPAQVCGRINSVLCANVAPGKFATLFYGVLDANTHILRYTNAGHLRPILIGDNGFVHHLENGGALLGVFADWRYKESSVELRAGDLLVLFTDGITEAMSPDGTEFGEDRLITAVTGAPSQPLADLQSQVLAAVKNFCNNHMSDDATLVLLAAARVCNPKDSVHRKHAVGAGGERCDIHSACPVLPLT